MSLPIRVLGIVPYENMKFLMQELVGNYPEIDLTIFVGDMNEGVKIAQSNFYGSCDAVISRGETAKLLKQSLTLPVVEIGISIYDILCALKLAGGLEQHTAVVSLTNITERISQLNELLGCNIDVMPIESPDDIEPALLKVRDKNYGAILCDTICNTVARRLGLNSFLITSGSGSIKYAFEQVLVLCRNQTQLRAENRFFREILQGQISQTVIFDNEGRLLLSSIEKPSERLLELLRQELRKSCADGADVRVQERHITRTLDKTVYSIRIRHITTGNLSCIAFFFTTRRSFMHTNRRGMHFLTRAKAEEDVLYNNIICLADNLAECQQKIEGTNIPVMLSGEEGMGKERIAIAMHLRSAFKDNTFISIDCALLSKRSWNFLLEHYNSPLNDDRNTIYFSNIDIMSETQRRQLLALLNEIDVCQRNKVILSCICRSNETTSEAGAFFINGLSCMPVLLPPLRARSENIPMLVNLLLNSVNVNMSRQILGMSAEALNILQEYSWPYNYAQLQRVVKSLAETAAGQIITSDEVRNILRLERHIGVFPEKQNIENDVLPLNLNRTLSEIERDILKRVLMETNESQSAVAKRLGISRTTLWRMLQRR